jgi:hypothetical protein
VCLRPERQAALQAIIEVESGGRYVSVFYPYARAFFRLLTGRGKITGKALNTIVGVSWDPRERLATLAEYEMAFDTLIRTRGEFCPTPLSSDLTHTLFPEVEFYRRERLRRRGEIAGRKSVAKFLRQQGRKKVQEEIQYYRVLQLAAIDLNFQSPDTFARWNRRHSELNEYDWLQLFWRWQTRFPSLQSLDWFRYSDEPRHSLVWELCHIVQETPEPVRARERLYIPNKLRDLTRG